MVRLKVGGLVILAAAALVASLLVIGNRGAAGAGAGAYLPVVLGAPAPAPTATPSPTVTVTATAGPTSTTTVPSTATPTATSPSTQTATSTATATPSPTAASTVAPGSDLRNGDFELGRNGDWSESSTHQWDLVVKNPGELPLVPHSGKWAAWLGGDDEETAVLSQPVTVPADRKILRYWYWIDSTDVCGKDTGGVLVNNVPVDEYALCVSTDTGGWVMRSTDLAAYAGQQVTLAFRLVNDEGETSSLFIDDVAFVSAP